MKKLLVILLTLAMVMGAFSGLTLFTVSAETSATEAVEGKYAYIDFEGEGDIDKVSTMSSTLVGKTLVTASDLAAAGIPAKTPTGKTIGNAVRFDCTAVTSSNQRYVGGVPVTAENFKAVVDGAGWYTVSFWIFIETPTINNDKAFRLNIRPGSSVVIVGSGSATNNKSFGEATYIERSTEWQYFEASIYIGTECAAAIETNANPIISVESYNQGAAYLMDGIRFTKLDGVDYDYMQLFKVEPNKSWVSPYAIQYGRGLRMDEAGTTGYITTHNFNAAVLNIWTGNGLGGWQGRALPQQAVTRTATLADWTGKNVGFNDDIYTSRNSTSAGSALTGTTAEYLGGFPLWHTNWDTFGISNGDTGNSGNKVTVIAHGKPIKYAQPAQPIYSDTIVGGNVWYYCDVDGCFTAKATANSGYTFKGWYTGDSIYGANTLVSTDAQIQTYGDKVLVAKFDGDFATVLEKAIGDGSTTDGWGVSGGGVTIVSDPGSSIKGASDVIAYDQDGSIAWGGANFNVSTSINIDKDAGYFGGGAGIYTVGFWARINPDDTDNASLSSFKSNLVLEYTQQAGGANRFTIQSAITLTKEWKYYTYQFEITDEFLTTTAVPTAILIRFDGNTSGGYNGASANNLKPYSYLVDDMQVTKATSQVLTVGGEGNVIIDGEYASTASVYTGQTVTISADEILGKTLVGVKYVGSNSQIYPAVDGVVSFVMPGTSANLELVWADTEYNGTRITVIGFDNVIFDVVDDTSKLLSATVRVGYTATYNVNGTAYSTFADAKAEAERLVAAGITQFNFTYVYAKKASDTVYVFVNGSEGVAVDRFSLFHVTAADMDANNYNFAYWADAAGKPISYNKTIAFYPAGNTYITAVYLEEAAVQEDYIEISNFVKNSDLSLAVVSERNFVTQTLTSHGIRLIEASQQLTADQINDIMNFRVSTAAVEGADVTYTLYAKKNSSQGTFVATKRVANPEKYYYTAAIYKVNGSEEYVATDFKAFGANMLDSTFAGFENVNNISQMGSQISAASGTTYNVTFSTEIANDADSNGNYLKFGYTSTDGNSKNTGYTWGAPYLNLSPYINQITEAGTYTISFRYKVVPEEGITAGATLRPMFRGTLGNFYLTNSPSIGGTLNEWVEFSGTFTISEENLATAQTGTFNFTFDNVKVAAIATVGIDDFTLTKGTTSLFIYDGYGNQNAVARTEANNENAISFQSADLGYKESNAQTDSISIRQELLNSSSNWLSTFEDSFSFNLAASIAKIKTPGVYNLRYATAAVKKSDATLAYNEPYATGALTAAEGYESILGGASVLEIENSVYKKDKNWQFVTVQLYIDDAAIADAVAGKPIYFYLANQNNKVQYIYTDNIYITKSNFVDEVYPKTATEWRAVEFNVFGKPATTYDNFRIDAVLTKGNTTLTVPGFWDGESNYKIRVALPEAGVWNYTIQGTALINGTISGKIVCSVDPAEELDIYKNGFVKEDGKYFTYDDGTPFYYFGDTHWNFGGEINEVYGNFQGYEYVGFYDAVANPNGTASGYKYTGTSETLKVNLIDATIAARKNQGYTVIQNQPQGVMSGIAELSYITTSDLAYWNKLDQAYGKLADAGLVNANSFMANAGHINMFVELDKTKPLAVIKSTPVVSDTRPQTVVSWDEFKAEVGITSLEFTPSGAVCNSDLNDGWVFQNFTGLGFQRWINTGVSLEEMKDSTSYGDYVEYYIAYDYTDAFYEKLDNLARLTVARYGSYPVMWTLGQEADMDNYSYRTMNQTGAVDQNGIAAYQIPARYNWSFVNNPYLLVADYIGMYDTYNSPLTCHQEGGTHTYGNGVTTNVVYQACDPGTHFTDRVFETSNRTSSYLTTGNPSVFLNTTAHSWVAAQISPSFWTTTINGNSEAVLNYSKDYYYNSNKPVVSFEAGYVYQGANNYAARYRAWHAFFNGQAGYAYGAQQTWAYGNSYSCHFHYNGNEQCYIKTHEKQYATYLDGLNFNSGAQVHYVKTFFDGLAEKAGKNIDITDFTPAFGDRSYTFDPGNPDMGDNKDTSILWNAMYNGPTLAKDIAIVYFGDNNYTPTYSTAEDGAIYNAANSMLTGGTALYNTDIVNIMAASSDATQSLNAKLAANLSDAEKFDIFVLRNGGFNNPAMSMAHSDFVGDYPFYGGIADSVETGTLKGLVEGATYKCGWFNVVTGEFEGETTQVANSGGMFAIGDKPYDQNLYDVLGNKHSQDYVFYAIKQ